eukprot:TRINITY_DN10556_c0_g1_i5.p1 TRINITY_DN10556_c0_g1~~TRINITY_DN10556_c0_g1_i5.p1  ORF type:complete len:418 (+),score=126.13 TRINITY_DN10556_c0_g1_i5:385-1638(+)
MCLTALVTKGMSSENKLLLLEMMQLPSVLASVKMDDSVDFEECVAELVRAIVEELLGAANEPELCARANIQLEQCMPLLLTLFNNEDDDVSLSALPAVSAFIAKLKTHSHIPNSVFSNRKVLEQMVEIISQKLQYSEDYDFEQQDDAEAQFQQYRAEICVVFKNIARFDRNLVKMFTLNALTNALSDQALQVSSFSEVEVALTLLYEIGEPLLDEASKPHEGMFAQFLNTLFSSGVSFHPHEAVILSFFENVNRYCKFLTYFPEFIPNVLSAFLDQRGVRNNNVRVRSRVCYLFSKTTDSLRLQLTPFIPLILSNLQGVLTMTLASGNQSSSDNWKFDDQQYLYEAVGIVIGSENNPVENQVAHLSSLTERLVEQLCVAGKASTVVVVAYRPAHTVSSARASIGDTHLRHYCCDWCC